MWSFHVAYYLVHIYVFSRYEVQHVLHDMIRDVVRIYHTVYIYIYMFVCLWL